MRLRALKLLGVALLLALIALRGVSAATYGLVVGIDDYDHLEKLRGAVNDARDIAAALEQAGAQEVVLLLDHGADRQAILGAWGRLLSRAKRGDTIVFTYAGHGGQEPEHWPGSESDGLDETFLLAGFREAAPWNSERLRDNEIGELFRAAAHINIVFLADSCHSGTMTRAVDPRARFLGTRLGEYGAIEDDVLAPPADVRETPGDEGLKHVVFFAAVGDHQLAPELMLDGKPRGALSWAFARALRGQADRDADRRLTTKELEAYLTANVRAVSEGRQLPRMAPRGQPVEIVIPLEVPADNDAPESDSAPLQVSFLKSRDVDSLMDTLRDVAHQPNRDEAELVWDLATGEVISALGDVVARLPAGVRPDAFQPVADKWLLLRDLKIMAETRPVQLNLAPDDRLHRQGAVLRVTIDGRDSSHLTLFNLASDGTIQHIAPAPQTGDALYSGRLSPGRAYELPLRVTPPFGADHLVALTSPQRLRELERLLERFDQKRQAQALRRHLPVVLAKERFSMGTLGLYTAP